MRFFLLLLVFLAASWACPAAFARQGAPLPCVAERLVYSLRWSVVPVGVAVLERTPEDGACVMRVEVRSNLLTDLVASVRDTLESRVDDATGRPLSFRKNLNEGDDARAFEVRYLWDAGSWRREADGSAPVFLAAPRRHDPLSVLYHFRQGRYVVPGDTGRLPVSDGRVAGEASAVFLGRDRIHVAGKFVDVLAFDYDQGGIDGLLRTAAGAPLIHLFVTDDALRLPVLLTARAIVAGFEGEVTAMLLRARIDGRTVLEF